MRADSRLAIGPLVVLIAIVGCDRVPSLPTVPVTGTLTYKGQPIAAAHVSFMPVDLDSGKPATGVTDAQGRFAVETPLGGSKFAKGALMGDYTIIVTKAILAVNQSLMSPDEWARLSDEERMKKRASSSTSSPPKLGESSDDVSGDFSIPSELAAKYANVKTSDLKAKVEPGMVNEFEFDLKDD